jgi:ABC-type transporter Mla subunit MlaD
MQPDDAAGPAVITFPQTPGSRLRVALRQLDAALAEQRDAMAAFRREIAALGTAVGELGDSASILNRNLAAAATDTQRAQDAAARLLATAAAMERLN